jgi:hypothetical protein
MLHTSFIRQLKLSLGAAHMPFDGARAHLEHAGDLLGGQPFAVP